MMDTPDFKQWFGGSKVVDSKGKPLRLYHGTAGDFSAFDSSRVGSRHVDVEAGPAFFFTDDPSTANYYAQSSGRQAKADARKSGQPFTAGPQILPVYLSFQNPLIVDFMGEGLEYLGEEIERAKVSGFDGLIAQKYNDGEVSTHFVAFFPEQIKSAIGNNGNYDAANHDIRFSLAAEDEPTEAEAPAP